MAPPRLRILVFPETHGTWTARGLEHDLAAEGRTIEAAVDTLLKIARAHVAYDRRHNREPLSAFAPCSPPEPSQKRSSLRVSRFGYEVAGVARWR